MMIQRLSIFTYVVILISLFLFIGNESNPGSMVMAKKHDTIIMGGGHGHHNVFKLGGKKGGHTIIMGK